MSLDAPRNMTIPALHKAYAENSISPEELMNEIRLRAAELEDHKIWIHLLSQEEQAPYLENLKASSPDTLPLWGIPFVMKDNIDLAGIPTTAGCEAFAYTPENHATVVQQLIEAGAIPVGKANLDQFATGLNGTRSHWGACKNAFDPSYVSGGSSSGSSVSVALGLASFSLGTDTAGSGRVPACFNNLVGVKPSIGLLSSTGMVPACRSLDCISIFALDTDDANTVLSAAEGFDASDGYSRSNPFLNQARQYGHREGPLSIGIIPDSQLKFFGDEAYQQAYRATIKTLADSDIELVEIDYTPFNEAAELLYEGPWVTERYVATQPLIDEQPEAFFPVVRDIIEPGGKPPASALFKAQYRLKELKLVCDKELAKVDCLLTPTAGRCFTIEDMLEEPILYNSQLGYYTNFMNLLDYAALALPTKMASNGLPFGITLAGPCMSDRALLSIGKRMEALFELNIGRSSISKSSAAKPAVYSTSEIDILVCGAHLQGLPLNWQLTERGASLKLKTQTAAKYRMYALAGGPPYRPGLIKDSVDGSAIQVEIWSIPASEFGSFVKGIPSPLGIGKVELEDGSEVAGFICEPFGIEGAEEITEYGAWTKYIASK